MNSPTVRSAALLPGLLALALACAFPDAAEAQRQRGFPLNKGGMREALHPNLPPLPLSPAWKDPAALERGQEMMDRLVEAAGGWEAYQELGGFRYDSLVRSKMNTGAPKNPWKVHHYLPRLAHFNTTGSGYLYSEWAKPSLTGPDFVREVMFEDVSWREMRGGYGRTWKAARVSRSNVRLERLTGTMPFSLKAMGAKLAFMREEQSELGNLEVYAMQLADKLLINYYPWIVDEFGYIEEFHLVVDPTEPRVVQLRFAFPDETKMKPPLVRWWTYDFEGKIQLGDKCVLPHKRFRWLEEWNEITDILIEDVVVERIPPPALRRPWQTQGVYKMPYRSDAWDPPEGVHGLTGHGTGLPDLPAGEYPPDHPKSRGQWGGWGRSNIPEDEAEAEAEEGPR